MKIECPSCHMTGKINEMELPPDGRSVHCPRCKSNFHVAKPAPAAGLLVNICPVCQYSTFSEEMFTVCPKCGVSAADHKEKQRKQAERDQVGQRQHAEVQSHHNPDLITAVSQKTAMTQNQAPEAVRITGWACVAVGALLMCYGLTGLANYYSRDWQAFFSESVLEPVPKTQVFFRLGFLPWLITLFSACFLSVAAQFLMLRRWAHKGLITGAWGGVFVAIVVEVAHFIKWAGDSSSTPSFSYYAVGVLESIIMILLWSAPCWGLIWYLQHKNISTVFQET